MRVILCFFLGTALLLGGCHEKKYNAKQEAMLAQVSIGTTTQDLLSRFGEPKYKCILKPDVPGNYVWMYDITPKNLNEIIDGYYKADNKSVMEWCYSNGVEPALFRVNCAFSVTFYIYNDQVIGWEDTRIIN